MMSDSSWLARILSADALATLRILPRSGRMAWVSRSRACFAEPPALSPSTRKISVPAALPRAQSASLPGRRNLRVAVFGALDDVLEQQARRRRVGAEPVVEMVLDRVLDEPRRFGRSQALLGLALE